MPYTMVSFCQNLSDTDAIKRKSSDLNIVV